jgi:hypothetical protein
VEGIEINENKNKIRGPDCRPRGSVMKKINSTETYYISRALLFILLLIQPFIHRFLRFCPE